MHTQRDTIENTSVIVSWSGGKDSALMVQRLLEEDRNIETLFTTLSAINGKMPIHNVSGHLIAGQAKAIGIPWHPLYLPDQPGHSQYQGALAAYLNGHQGQQVAYGDLFLDDIRKYRQNLHQDLPEAVFPLWEQDTRQLAAQFIEYGFKAVVTSVNADILDPAFVGRDYDQSFLRDLPSGVDPCGENGEFHSFVYDGPYFDYPVSFKQYPVEVLEVGKGSVRMRIATTELWPTEEIDIQFSQVESKVCEKCGINFACGANNQEAPCWCTSFPPLESLDIDKDCLCPGCLDRALNSNRE